MIRPTEQWKESTLRAIGYSMVGLTATGVLANVVLSAVIGDVGNSTEQILLLVPFIFVIVWLFRAVPRNTAIWALAWAAVCGGLGDTASTYVLWRTGSELDLFLSGAVAGSPSDLSVPIALALNFAAWSWLGIFLLSVHFVLLFPSGSVSSRRWLYLMRSATAVFVLGVLTTVIGLAPWVETSFADLFDEGVFWAAGTVSFLMMFASVATLANLIVRFWRSTGDERLQYRWVTSAFAFWAILLVGFGWFSDSVVFDILYTAALGAIPVSIGIAITKHRLYDIDVVISRTLVYGALAVFIGAVYVGIVVGVGILVGDPSTDVWLQLAATVVIAIAFQPLRRLLQRVANRVVYGKRATPYEVLSSFSQGISAVDPTVLTQVARSLAEGTTADAASIWVGPGDDAHRIASWPRDRLEHQGHSTVSTPVKHAGDDLGKVVLEIPPGQPFPITDERLVEQVASGLGLALRNLQLTEDLADQVDQLRESRRRVVALQDQTRRLLERDLHDGAQQRLVALKIKIGLAGTMASKEELTDVQKILDEVREETDLTIDSLRNLARGIYPPLLEAEGLGAALSAQLRRVAIPVTVQAAGIGRYPEEIEATFYFCVLEAVQNAVKHARSKSVLVTVREDGGQLVFEVRDDGVGFDVETARGGQGLINMADRLDAVEGAMEVESGRGRGTVVTGNVPIRELVS